jgi:Uma2 family endonuclease
MTVASQSVALPAEAEELHSGDRMSRAEFHRIYSQMPEGFKAELVEGVVYVASPLKIRHGRLHLRLGALFAIYEGSTRGVEAGDNTTVLLGDESEPQPDLYLRVLPQSGGQSRTSDDDYVEGAPELVAEVAYSTRSIDLHAKRRDYLRHGVLEYLVANVRDHRLVRLDLKNDTEHSTTDDGIVRVHVFPGLWIDSDALFRNDYARLMEVLQQGLASPEHAAFVQRLAAAGPGKPAT